MAGELVIELGERIEQVKRDWSVGRMGVVPSEHEFIPLPTRRSPTLSCMCPISQAPIGAWLSAAGSCVKAWLSPACTTSPGLTRSALRMPLVQSLLGVGLQFDH